MKSTQKLQNFENLHKADTPLLLGNVWDAHSAKIAQELGYKALGTSSHAIAFSLGYSDGEQIPFKELKYIIERIVAVTSIPVSVDFESGYSDDPDQVANYILELEELGVVGVNLEDGKVVDGKRVLSDTNLLIEKIKAIRLKSEIFINARIDTYTTKHPEALQESIIRAKQYKIAGADGVFIPLIEKETDISSFVSEIDLPLNVFTTLNLPSYERLTHLGVKRISHGAKQYDKLMKLSESLFSEFRNSKDYSVLLG